MEGLQPEQLRILFRWFKEGPPGAIAIEQSGRSLGMLQAAGWEDAGSAGLMDELSAWNRPAFPDRAAARRWLTDEVLPTPDRVLFWVRDVRGRAVGHVGLADLDSAGGTMKLTDVLCGVPGSETLVAAAVEAVVHWVHHALHLQVYRDPQRQVMAA
jgi:hypothetical protein